MPQGTGKRQCLDTRFAPRYAAAMSTRTPDANLRGALFMTAAMAAFAVEDMFLKAAAKTLPMGQILIAFALIGMLVFRGLAHRRGEVLLHPALHSPAMRWRMGFEVAGRLFYALAIVLTPLSSSAAILQAAPLLVMGGAAWLFGERIGLQRWLAIGIGLAGVMLILRPGTDGFSLLSLLAVIGTIGFAGRDLATRAAPRVLSHWQLGFWGFAMLLVAGLILTAWDGRWAEPSLPSVGLVLAGSGFGIGAYTALTFAMRTGDVGAVTPFRYSRLVFAMALGILVFGERPDVWTLAGAALIVASGIYALTAGRRRALDSAPR